MTAQTAFVAHQDFRPRRQEERPKLPPQRFVRGTSGSRRHFEAASQAVGGKGRTLFCIAGCSETRTCPNGVPTSPGSNHRHGNFL